MIVIDEKFLVIKEINGYLVVMILINSFRSGSAELTKQTCLQWSKLSICSTIRSSISLLFPFSTKPFCSGMAAVFFLTVESGLERGFLFSLTREWLSFLLECKGTCI
jgi:hypothetical protein